MLIEQTNLTVKFWIFILRTISLNKGNLHLKDDLPEEQNPWEEKEKAILETATEIGEKVKPSQTDAPTNFPSKLFIEEQVT